jgi:hypothetical protein
MIQNYLTLRDAALDLRDYLTNTLVPNYGLDLPPSIINPFNAALQHTPERPLVYLAAPYTHPSPDIRRLRVEAANRHAAELMKEGWVAFSPLSHSHSIAKQTELPTGWEFWRKFCETYVGLSRAVIVLMLPGWQESTGVTAEIALARSLNIPVEYREP